MSDTIKVNSPWERAPVCACDPGKGPPPTKLKMMECRIRRGPCSPQNDEPQTRQPDQMEE